MCVWVGEVGAGPTEWHFHPLSTSLMRGGLAFRLALQSFNPESGCGVWWTGYQALQHRMFSSWATAPAAQSWPVSLRLTQHCPPEESQLPTEAVAPELPLPSPPLPLPACCPLEVLNSGASIPLICRGPSHKHMGCDQMSP